MLGTLLIVDDEEDVLGVLVEYLGGLGYNVVSAGTGHEALEKLNSTTHFDVAVVDWTLPDIAGKDLLRAVRERRPECAVVVTTGHGAEVVNEGYAGLLAGSIVRKPFTMRTLALRVATLLEKSRTDR